MVKLDFTKFKAEQGRLLLSEPFSNDPNFKRTVVLLASHNEEGSIGFVLNRPMISPLEEGDKKYGGCLNLEQVVEEFKGCKFPVWDGGPVQRDSLFYIHTLGETIPESIHIVDDLYWSGNFETVKALIKGNKISESEIRLFVGYSGWSSGQLQGEIKRNSWLVTPATVGLVMDGSKSTDKKLWEDVLKSMGKEYGMIANFPENPMWN